MWACMLGMSLRDGTRTAFELGEINAESFSEGLERARAKARCAPHIFDILAEAMIAKSAPWCAPGRGDKDKTRKRKP